MPGPHRQVIDRANSESQAGSGASLRLLPAVQECAAPGSNVPERHRERTQSGMASVSWASNGRKARPDQFSIDVEVLMEYGIPRVRLRGESPANIPQFIPGPL